MGDSIRFDRAVDYYDRTRALTPGTQARMVESLSRELAGRGRVLEIGVGTGRIALPLREAGVDVVGIDLSAPMLERLLSKGDAPVVVGDATRLPFRDDAFGAAVAVHVLHLIPEWRRAIAELARVVEPGGTLLVSQGAWNVVAFPDVIEVFSKAGGLEMRHPGVNEEAELDEAMITVGAVPRDLVTIHDSRRGTLAAMIDSLRDGLYSFTWPLDEETRGAAADAAAAYAEKEHGPLDEERDIPTEMRWRAYDLAAE
ncbi:MAG TPA: class I SAM-dependent methyltransferase [Actinomycetota bacterium]|nr:class I SAM-dependent methyltransferase [Actinomycetota bacterium]